MDTIRPLAPAPTADTPSTTATIWLNLAELVTAFTLIAYLRFHYEDASVPFHMLVLVVWHVALCLGRQPPDSLVLWLSCIVDLSVLIDQSIRHGEAADSAIKIVLILVLLVFSLLRLFVTGTRPGCCCRRHADNPYKDYAS